MAGNQLLRLVELTYVAHLWHIALCMPVKGLERETEGDN